MDQAVSKLILLYVLDQMEIPVTSETLNDMCCSQNSWLTYMTLTEILPELVTARFIYGTTSAKMDYYKITQEGRDCLNFFFIKIPFSVRKEICAYIKKNRQAYKRKQEYFKDYRQNKDGTYTVNLKIDSAACTLMDLKIVVQDRRKAKWIHNNWAEKAPIIYEHIHENLID